jgi:hypothetical protein
MDLAERNAALGTARGLLFRVLVGIAAIDLIEIPAPRFRVALPRHLGFQGNEFQHPIRHGATNP